MYGRCIYCRQAIKYAVHHDETVGEWAVWESFNGDNFCEDNDFYNFHEPFIKLKLYTNDA